MTGTGTRPVGATEVSARAIAPDLARGAMLLLIALANAHVYLHGHPIGIRGYPLPESLADQVVVLLQMALVDGRAYPMFALLFGYGIVQLLRRQLGSGVDQTMVLRLVRRRGWWLILFGFLHALLLFSGDILGSYGLLAVLLAGVLLRAGDRTLLMIVVLWTVPILVFGAFASLPASEAAESVLPSMAISDPLVAALWRVGEWVSLSMVISVLGLIPALLFGAWAARQRFLDEPEQHRRLLRWTAVLGVGLAAVGGLPLALMAAGWWPERSVVALALAGAAHSVTGYLGGAGYAAIAGLVAIRLRERVGPGPMVTALTACGQRSLTCYLLQSVVFVAVLAGYGGGLGDRFGLAATALLAIATWTLIVLPADLMRRRGYRGPAELLLRRLTYGRR